MSERLTPERLEGIRERADAATPGPWAAKCSGHDYPYIETEKRWQLACGEDFAKMPDAAFIAAARTDIPDLLSHIDAIEAELATALDRAAHWQEEDRLGRLLCDELVEREAKAKADLAASQWVVRAAKAVDGEARPSAKPYYDLVHAYAMESLHAALAELDNLPRGHERA